MLIANCYEESRMRIGRHYAIESAREALSLDTGSHYARRSLGQLYLKSSKFKEAESLLRHLLD